MNASRRTSLLFVCFAMLFCSGFVFAQNTINVPADQTTIQKGIDSARDGDTVLVAPGTYVENINFHGKNVTVKSSGGRDVTTIDGNNLGSVVTFSSGETNSAILDGFTLTHGFDTINHDGGGISISNSSPTIQRNIITANGGTAGLGIYSYQSSPIIQFNNIHHNAQSFGSGGGGGGISLLGGSAQIINNTIANNSITGGGTGGGITINNGGHLISGNWITANYAVNGGGAIALINDSTALIVNNLITNNTAGAGGAGIGIDDGMSISTPNGNRGAYVFNNTLVNNGLYIVGFFSQMLIENNIFYGGTKTPIYCSGVFSSRLPFISNNDFFSTNANGGICANIAGTNGNISTDPLFVNPAGDWQLTASSPAIDSGNNSAPGLAASDFSGNPRIADGNGDGSAVVDMGAYEYVYQLPHLSYSPDHLDFGQVRVGAMSTSQTITITNDRANVLRINSISITPTDPGTDQNFTIASETGNCTALNVGDKCYVTVEAVPVTAGSVAANVYIQSNAGNPVVPLTVVGTQPQASVNPASQDFGSGLIGTTSTAATITYQNTGTAPLNFSISSSGDFAQTNNCTTPLLPNTQCQISVQFKPTAAGTRTGSLIFTDDAPGSPHSAQLQGTGVAPGSVAEITPSSLMFGLTAVGDTLGTHLVTLASAGNLPLHFSISISGDFSQTNDCISPLPIGAQCQISVWFSPKSMGNRSGLLSFGDDATGGPHSVVLGGTSNDYELFLTPPSNVPIEMGRPAFYSLFANDLGGTDPLTPIFVSCYTTAPNASCSLQQGYVTTGLTVVVTVNTTKPQGKVGGTPAGTYSVFVQSNAIHKASATLVIKK